MTLKVVIIDDRLKEMVSIKDIILYLERNNWSLYESHHKGWFFGKEKFDSYILVPFSKEYADINYRLYDIIEVLEEEENRSQLDILADIMGISTANLIEL